MMKNKFSLLVIIGFLIAGVLIVTACDTTSSPPTVKIGGNGLRADGTMPVCIGETVLLVTQTTGTDLTYTWNLDGNGKLEHQGGDSDEGSSNRYTAPTTSSDDAAIKVTVTDASNQSATNQIIMIIQVQECATSTPSPTETSMPPATDTPASPTPTIPTATTGSCDPETFTKTLRILQWEHFVTEYDGWFDDFAKDWGCENKVNVIVDHIGVFNLAFCLDAEITEADDKTPTREDFDIESCFNEGNPERKEGERHDLIEMVLPPHQFASDLVNLTQFIENQLSLGEQAKICRQSSSSIDNETGERKYFGLCHGWVPELGNYRSDLWEEVGFSDGPSTYEELLEGGRAIKNDLDGKIKVGIGLKPTIGDPALDINNGIRAIFWSYGAYVQDENQNVVISSPETIEATKYIARLYNEAMDSSVLDWNGKSNNVCLAEDQHCSYIINAISAYRDAQNQGTDRDIVLTKPLSSSSNEALAPPHVVQVYVMPRFVDKQDIAKNFLQAFIAEYDRVVEESRLYTLSAWPDKFPIPEDSLKDDPKLEILEKAIKQEQNWRGWTRNIGYPGPTNAAVIEVFRQNILSNMVLNAALGAQAKGLTDDPYHNDELYKEAAREAMLDAKEQICRIFEQQFGQANVGGCQ